MLNAMIAISPFSAPLAVDLVIRTTFTNGCKLSIVFLISSKT